MKLKSPNAFEMFFAGLKICFRHVFLLDFSLDNLTIDKPLV